MRFHPASVKSRTQRIKRAAYVVFRQPDADKHHHALTRFIGAPFPLPVGAVEPLHP